MSKSLDSRQFVSVLKGLFGDQKGAQCLHAPEFGEAEKRWLNECIESGWVSTAGPFVPKFEDAIKKFTDAPHCVATSNGTSALHACLVLSDVKAGEEVLVPTLTFIATANAVSYCGATPHFVDISLENLGVDTLKLDSYLSKILEKKDGVSTNKLTGRPLKTLVVVHTFGHPADLDGLKQVCEKYSLTLIEDAAEALGSRYKDKHVGLVGKFSALSFNGNKMVTTGGGGAILCTDQKLAEHAKHLTTTAKVSHPWAFVHDEVGYNYRLPNLNAALGCAQMEKAAEFLKEKRQLAQKYISAFKDFDVQVFEEPEHSQSNYWLNAILLKNADLNQRDGYIETAVTSGFGVRPVWRLMHKLDMYKDCPRMDLSTSEDVEGRLINLPSSACLGRES